MFAQEVKSQGGFLTFGSFGETKNTADIGRAPEEAVPELILYDAIRFR